jgi:central glycolytic genes regulator
MVPEVSELLERRYVVLRAIAAGEPIGRRALADRLGWSERVTRSEVEFLRCFGLVELNGAGVTLSEAGRQILAPAAEIVAALRGLAELQRQLEARFSLRRAFVVPGNYETELISRDALARATGEAILSVLGETDVVVVSGGSTLADVTRRLPIHESHAGITVAPTGGGLGDALEIEANTVAVQLARSLGAKSRLLHLPADLDPESVHLLVDAEPAVREMFELIRSASIVVQGVGTLRSVAGRRGFTAARVDSLEQRGAVGESLGHFFGIDGRVVEAGGGVGLRLEDLGHAAHVIAVAAGASKAAAITSLLRTGLQHIVVTDEAAARAILAIGGPAQ